MNDQTVPRNSNLPAGYDEDDPYKDKNLQNFPPWWRKNIEIFREHRMRPYRPPKFRDGVITHEVIYELEETLGISIQFKAVNPEFGGDWGIWIDDKEIMQVDRQRTEEGRTVYGITSEQFKDDVRQVISHKEEDQ